MTDSAGNDSGVSRRAFLGTAALGAGMLWKPIRTLTALDPETGGAPPGFPSWVKLTRTEYENWSGEIRIDDVWSAPVTSTDEILAVVNWAAKHGWQVRPSGARHGWAPFNVMPDQPREAETIIVDTRKLNTIGVDKKSKTVYAQAGAMLDDIMIALENEGLGFTSIPAPGSLTITGALAINGHGAAIPAKHEDTRGRSYGSLSNRVVWLRAVVWDATRNEYVIKKFDRTNPETKALLTSLGRTFVTSLVMKAESAVNLRCVSFTDIPSTELFAAPGSKGRTFESYLDSAGRAEAILFPFTTKPWFKVWWEDATKPKQSRAVSGPYNYPFSDNVPLVASRLARAVLANEPKAAETFGNVMYKLSRQGLKATNAIDIWGPPRMTQHYIKASTLRASEFGYAILTKRSNVQRVLHEFVGKYLSLQASYKARGLTPANMPIELRCTGVDDPSYVGVAGAEPPAISATSPHPARPDWDTVVFVNALGLVGSEGEFTFKRDLEEWCVQNYSGDYALARVEWSKGWAYTDQGGWRSKHILDQVIPNGFPQWNWTVAQFNALDPKRVFTNPLLERLMG